MKKTKTLIFLLCAALTSCAIVSQKQELIDNPTSLSRELFNTVSADQFENVIFTSSRGAQLPYRLLRPSRLNPGKVYPLVVQLHGSGEIGTDNVSQLDRLAKSWAMPDVRDRYQAFILIPQFSIRSSNYGPASPDQHAVPSAMLNDTVELIKQFSAANPVDKSRIYASGFSMGGSATWLLPSIAPGMFAGIVPMCGIAPPNSLANSFTNLPIIVIHGDADMENQITADRRFVQAITGQGGQQVTLREYKGLKHQPPSDVYPGYWWRDWLFSQQLK